MATHTAIVTTVPGKLEATRLATPPVLGNKVKLINQWTASTPLDLHQADGHLLVTPPQVLGDNVAGTVLEVGPDVQTLRPGDHVFGFTWRGNEEKGHQTHVVTTENVLAKLPAGISMREAVTVPDNFVTAWHALTHDLGFTLPWPVSAGDGAPEESRQQCILIWGGSSSVGMYAIQILRRYGYDNVIATASEGNHEQLLRYGARVCFDYRQGDTLGKVRTYLQERGEHVGFALDCIGSQAGSVGPVAQLVNTPAARVAVLLPVIVRDPAPGMKPEYEMDPRVSAAWAEGVEVRGVRTFFYTDDAFLAEKLQPEIMPAALSEKMIEPNRQVLVEGSTLLERAEKALGMLREKSVSGGRLVWRIAEEEEVDAATKFLLG